MDNHVAGEMKISIVYLKKGLTEGRQFTFK